MRSALFGSVLVAAAGVIAVSSVGCGPAPPCETSLVVLDETRLDAETYEQEAAETGEKVADLRERLQSKQKDIEAIEDKPAELNKKVYELKKGSGRE